MKLLNLVIIILLVFAPMVKGQVYTISGTVEDSQSGEALIGTSIYDESLRYGAVTNNYGFFSIQLQEGPVSLHFSYLGYSKQIMSFNLVKDTSISIGMESNLLIKEVTVNATDPGRKITSSQMGMIEMPMKKLNSIPFIMGEPDILKALQLMPGIQAGNEGSSGLFVRGGSPDQNLFLIDGVPVYNVNHLFGFFSVFNTDAIRNVSVLKGGFPARYGGRLSSVVDIRMKEGNNKEFHGEGSLGLIASKLSLEGPIIKDKTSYIISARRTYLDVIAQPVVKAVDDFVTARYYFYDINAKINHSINDKNRIFLSVYTGDDVGFYKLKDKYVEDEIHYTLENKMGLHWGNITTALRWNSILNNRLFCNTTLTYSKYRFKVYETDRKDTKPNKPSANSKYEWEFLSGIRDYSVRTDFDYFLSSNHYIRFGGSYTNHNFMPGTNNYDYMGSDYADQVDTIFGDTDLAAHEIDLYVEDDFNLTDKLKFNAGLHGSAFSVRSKTFISLQPRISCRYLVTDKISVKASASNMSQNIHLLTNTSISLPTDLWLPATDLVSPESSWQYSLGTVFPVSKLLFTVEGFYKTMENIIEYKEGHTFLNSKTNWESMVESGKGWAYGAEFLAEKTEGRTTGWIGYTLSWSNRQLESGNFGNVFPYKYDRRHNINFVVTHKLSDKIDVGATWTFGSGTALTLPTQKYISAVWLNEENNENRVKEIDYYKGRNSFRMPAYHRLDISVNFHKNQKWGESTLSLGLYNAYNRKNPFYIYIGDDTDMSGHGSGKKVVKQVSLFPLIPFINYSFKF